MVGWGFSDAQNVSCLCGTPQTMAHLTSCPACPNTCTQEELMTASDGAVSVAQFWQAHEYNYLMSGPEDTIVDSVKNNSNVDNANEMREALSAIAQEMQRFYSCSDKNEMESHDLPSDDLESFKSKLKVKKKMVKKLKDNLKTACTIAKTVIAAKENETHSLNNHLAIARNESSDLTKKNSESYAIIQKLTMENHVLSDKVQNLHHFIELGYKELQKMNNDTMNEASMLMKLKKIMICCGQYYADYCNEHEKCLQLEQRNRFLNNKLSILENNIGAVTEELKNYQQKERNAGKDKKAKNESQYNSYHKLGSGFSESTIRQRNNTVYRVATEEEENAKSTPIQSNSNLDLSSHLHLVKTLLNDQDMMLKDLKQLSDELSS